MTYSVPELLLVGAAQNLVLLNESDIGRCEPSTDVDNLQSDLVELW